MVKKRKMNVGEKLAGLWGNILAIISVILVVVVFGGAYYFVIAPNLVSKPFMEKPILTQGDLEKIRSGEQVIGSEHISYILNDVGGYKLHPSIGSDDLPVMEFNIKDTGKVYYAYVKDNQVTTKEGNPKKEDVVIKGNQEAVYDILASNSTTEGIKKALRENLINFELKSDMKTLAVKGYLSLYDFSQALK